MKKIILLALLILFLLIAGITAVSYYWLKSSGWEQIIKSEIVKERVGEENEDLWRLAPRFLGFSRPMTYLALFQNNTELRPGGGFIGIYGIIRLARGKMEIIKIEGTENLDRQAPVDWRPLPPQPLSDHLKVDRWYFRDANWSPDFKRGAEQALKLYAGEGGTAAAEIDAVVAFTPTVLEGLLKIIGPLTIQGLEFSADNVTEKLEYEVEYGYDERGIAFHERKQIVRPFFQAMMEKLSADFFNWPVYLGLVNNLAAEKHILVYALEPELQTAMEKRNWTGEVKQTDGDYLLWVDANLAALKTDHALVRTLRYALRPQADGRFLARAEMIYQHQGKFDWRTTRYRAYARVFAPPGSQLVSSGDFDQGEELGKTWFGKFISLEPGQTKTLVFEYLLPEIVSARIADGSYTLFVQKQLGTISHQLTLELDFGKNIVSANPAESEGERGDGIYKYEGDLREDRIFNVGF